MSERETSHKWPAHILLFTHIALGTLRALEIILEKVTVASISSAPTMC